MLGACTLEVSERVDGAAAGGEHRVEHEHARVGQPRRQPRVVVDRRVGGLVARHAEVTDARVGQQPQEAVDHPEPGAQHRHDHDLLGEPCAARRFERCLDLDLDDRELTCRFDREDRGALEKRVTEARPAGVAVPQDGQPVGQDGVLNERQLGRQRGDGDDISRDPTGARAPLRFAGCPTIHRSCSRPPTP